MSSIFKAAANTTAEAAAKNVAEAVAKTAAKNAAEAVAKTAAKNVAEAVAKAAAKNVAEAAAKAAAKNAAEAAAKKALKNTAKEAGESAAKNSSNFIKGGEKNARGLLKRVTQSVDNARSAMTKFITKNPKLVIGVLVGAAAGGYVLNKFMTLNDKTYKVVSIKAHTIGGILGVGGPAAIKIEYQSGGDKLRVKDTIVVTDSNSAEIADGGYIIQEVNNTANPAYLIANYGPGNSTKMPNITKPANTGNMMYKTTFESQLAGAVIDAGGAIGGIAGDIGGGVLDSVFPGISEYKTPILMFIFLVIFIVLLSYVYPMISGGSKGGGDGDSDTLDDYSAISDLLLLI
jgi:hypothetical protein